MQQQIRTAWPKIDYTALNQKPNREVVRRYWKAYMTKLRLFMVVFLGTGLLSAVFLVTFFAAIMSDDGFNFGWIAAPVGLVLCAYMVWNKWREIQTMATIYEFGTVNKLLPSFGSENYRYKQGLIFENCNMDSTLDVNLTISRDISLGNFTRSTGSGRSHREVHWGFAQFTLPRHLPHMVLDAKSNNSILGSNLDVGYAKSQCMSLEGDFDRHFTLYAPAQYKRDALYIFTPDVMAVMIDNGWKYDIEIIGNQMFFYHKSGLLLDKQATYQDIKALYDIILRKVTKQAKNYADERVGNRRIDAIAQPGQHLKIRTEWIAIIFGLIWFFYGLYSMIEPMISSLFR